MAWVMTFVLLGKLAGATKEMAIAYRYGVREVLDVYILVFTLVMWLPTVWTSVLQSVLVPLSVGLEDNERKVFHSQLTGLTLLVGSSLSLLLALALPRTIAMLPTRISDEGLAYASQFAVGLAPLTGAGFIIGLLMAQLLAKERHGNTLLEAIPALTLLATVLLWPQSGEIQPLLLGSLSGVSLQILGLWLLLRKTRWVVQPNWGFTAPAWRAFFQGIGIMAVGQFIMSFANPIDQLMAARLGEGAIATLGYANRLLALILGLGATAVGRAILPVLSEVACDKQQAWQLAKRWSQLLLLLGTVVVPVALWLAPWGVKILFERGAFTAEDTRTVTHVVQFGLLQLPFYFVGIVLVQFFVSLQYYWVILISGILAIFAKIVGNYAFSISFGVSGIALSTATMYCITCLYLISMVAFGRKKNVKVN